MISKKEFNPEKDLEDLTGKVVLITGGNRGIGYHTVKHLARQGATVYLGARSESTGNPAVAALEKEGTGKGKVIYTWCDFSTPEKAKETGDKFLNQVERLDIFVMSGAMLSDPRIKHMDDILATNHFGNLMLLQTLLPLIEETSDKHGEARIVTVSSMAHTLSRAKDPTLRFKSPDDFRRNFGPGGGFMGGFAFYAISKLCQQLTHTALHARNTHPNLFFISVDPGAVNTFSGSHFVTRFLSPVINLFFDSPEVGAYNSLFAAASPLIREEREKYDGKFMVPVGKLKPVGVNVTLEKATEMLDASRLCFEKEGMFPLLPREKETKAEKKTKADAPSK